MSFSRPFIHRRTKKSNFLSQIDYLIDWDSINKIILKYYHPKNDAIGRPAYKGLLLFKMLLSGIWYGGLSDEAVEELANSNLFVMRFLNMELEDDVPDHSVLSRFRSKLSEAGAWDELLAIVNQQIDQKQLLLKNGVHVDASITPTQRKPKRKPVLSIDEEGAVSELPAKGVDPEARWTKKANNFYFGFKQHTLVDNNGLVQSVITSAANEHDSRSFIDLVSSVAHEKGVRVHADKAYDSKKHALFLKSKGLKNGILQRAKPSKPLSSNQIKRNKALNKARFVVERTFGSQARWFNGKSFRYVGKSKAHAWHILQGIAYNLKRLPRLWLEKQVLQDSCA